MENYRKGFPFSIFLLGANGFHNVIFIVGGFMPTAPTG